MTLYLVRHGKYHSSESGDQPLSEEGRTETASVAHHLKKKNISIDEIRHSEKLRAKETAEIFGKVLGVKCLKAKGLNPSDLPEHILQELTLSDQNLMLVSHLPFLEQFLSALLGECTINFTNSCVVTLEKIDQRWTIKSAIDPFSNS